MRLALAILGYLTATQLDSVDYTIGSSSYYSVPHQGNDPTTEHDFINRDMPFVAIYSVEPAASECLEAKCWPVVHAFVEPAPFGGDQHITVECTAYSRRGERLAVASDDVSLRPVETGSIHLYLKYSDFTAIDHVVCEVKDHQRIHL